MLQLEEGVSNGLDWDGGMAGIIVYNRRHHCTLAVHVKASFILFHSHKS